MADYLSDSDVGLGAAQPPSTSGATPAAVSSAAPAASAEPKYLNDDDIGVKPADSPATLGSVAAQLPAGFNEGLADTVGAPVDLTTWLANKVLPEDYQIKKPFLGSDSIKSGLGVIHADPRNAPAKNAAERIARGVGSGVAAAVVPEAAVGTIGRMLPAIPKAAGTVAEAGSLPEGMVQSNSTISTAGEAVPTGAGQRVSDIVRESVGNTNSKGALATTAAAGGVGGGAGKTAAEVVPDQYKPYADIAGNLIGGGLTAAAPTAAGKVASAVASEVRPLTKAGQEAIAAKTIADAADNPEAALESLTSRPHEIVPGSKPTTFQQTGDMGLGSLERAVSTTNPAEFKKVGAEQNAARVGALSDLQPTGAPQAVSGYLKQRLDDIDQATQSAVDAATAKAKQATADLGPGRDADVHGQNISAAITPQVESATRNVANQTENLGGQGTPEQHGVALRQSLADAEANARASERQLWKSVDPDRKLVVATGPVTDAAKSAYGQLSPAATIDRKSVV